MQERVLSACQNICGQVQIFNHFDLLHLNERIMNLKETLINQQSGADEDSENYFTGSFFENKQLFESCTFNPAIPKNSPLLKLIMSFSNYQKLGNHDAGVWKS